LELEHPMPAGRPRTTGESAHVTFRAKPPLAQALTARRTLPDLTGDILAAKAAARTADKLPAPGAVASRDLTAYYALLAVELDTAAHTLTAEQAATMLDAIWSLAVDYTWITNAPVMLASEIEDAHPDDETGPDPARKALAATVRSWPRLRALAVLEALLQVRDNHEDTATLEEAFTRAGLIKPTRPRT
jgi:hypothetical protein